MLGYIFPFLFLTFFTASSAPAFDIQSKYSLPLSASFGFGSMESGDLGLKSRTMTAFSLESLPGYRRNKWILGLHLDYRWQGQMSSVSEAGESNLRGSGYLIGIGARRDFDERLFAQGLLDFLGEYFLSNSMSSGETGSLKNPFSVRLKMGYAFFEAIPQLTFDAELLYLRYGRISIAGNDHSQSLSQFMASVGATYHFGFSDRRVETIADEKKGN